MTTETNLSYDKDFIRSFSKELNEPAWMEELRLKALELSETLPMPRPDKTKIDKWNFTQFDSTIVNSEAFSSLADLPEEVKALIGDESTAKNLYIQRNHTPAYISLTQELKGQGVIFTDIFTAIREHSELVQKYLLNEAIKTDEHRLIALHAALMNGGAFLYIPKNVEIKEPIHSIYLHDSTAANLVNHVLVVADDNSAVTYVENYFSTLETADSVFNIVTEVIANAGAKVQYGAVDTLAKGVTTYVNRRGSAGRDARIEWALGLIQPT
jgi:Fe-S cluster assembly protein SufD